MKKEFERDLLTWYDNGKRVLPWRDNTDPYRVWISEIMLQQTRVNAVIPYFERFISTLPTVYDLSEVNDDRLMKLWEGLGYYSRARNLKKAAILVVSKFNSVVPNDYDDLLSLPGIGPYTAGAIMSIAYNKKYTAVDGNVLRVFARMNDIQEDIKDMTVKRKIKEYVNMLLPKRVGDFNQALMEIGATVCLPNGTPKCEICPLKSYCKAYQNGTISLIPKKRKHQKVPVEKKTVLLIKFENLVALEKRKDKGLLANMYQFPMLEGHVELKLIEEMFNEKYNKILVLPKSKHIFSHKKWDMVGYEIQLNSRLDYCFVTLEDIQSRYSVPTAFQVYKNRLEKVE